jgi:hypothetical protein
MNKLTKAEAVVLLIDAGAVLEKREDRHGDTKTGWWLDGAWLSNDPREAVRLMNAD